MMVILAVMVKGESDNEGGGDCKGEGQGKDE